MSQFDNEENQIKDILNQMPQIENGMGKDKLYQDISSKIHSRQKPAKKSKMIWVPVGSTIVALLLMILIIPPLFQNAMLETSNESSQSDALNDSASKEQFQATEESNPELFSAEGNEKNGDLPQASLLDKSGPSHAVYNPEQDRKLIHAALTDKQGQYIVPFSIMVPDTEEADYFYNKVGSFLKEEKWGLDRFVLEGATFNINQKENVVNIKLPENFTIGEGSTRANNFEDMLSNMFLPYELTRVTFDKEIDLGPFGTVEMLPLMPSKAVYKKYLSPDGSEEFLARVAVMDDADFSTALVEMKENEEVPYIDGVIPKNQQIKVQREGPLVRVQFSNPEQLQPSKETILMIDAIMMTAKSFGFDEVEFVNLPFEEVGLYNLNEPIKVPNGANPIYVNP